MQIEWQVFHAKQKPGQDIQDGGVLCMCKVVLANHTHILQLRLAQLLTQSDYINKKNSLD